MNLPLHYRLHVRQPRQLEQEHVFSKSSAGCTPARDILSANSDLTNVFKAIFTMFKLITHSRDQSPIIPYAKTPEFPSHFVYYFLKFMAAIRQTAAEDVGYDCEGF
ncbi:hypothetical protein ACVLD2_002302 [Paenibacillus sp. PvR052]